MAFAEDCAPYFVEFGVSATLDGAAVRVIFDDSYVATRLGAQGMASSGPMATLATATAPAVAFGSILVVPAGRYSVSEVRPDGTGLTTLVLEKAAPA